MKLINDILTDKFRKAALSAYPPLEQESDLPIELVPSTQDKFGHYQFNSSMKFAKLLGATPRQIAQSIEKSLDLHHEGQPMIEKLEIAGPGFINITLSPLFLSQYAKQLYAIRIWGFHSHRRSSASSSTFPLQIRPKRCM